MTIKNTLVTFSVVSHKQQYLVKHLLNDIEKNLFKNINVLLTLNIDETLMFDPASYSFPIQIIRNKLPKGFGENHNQAFTHCDTPFFCVINPDIRLPENPFVKLISQLNIHSAALIAPKVINPDGHIENSVRKFPTPWSIIKKTLIKKDNADYLTSSVIVNPDWVGGMFMLFKTDAFKQINGFDEQYFLYYEDVDICLRLHQSGNNIIYTPDTYVIHEARRSSHKNFRYLSWHLSSMLRFFIKWFFK